MAGVTTTYDVVTRYMVEHHGAPVVQQMTTQVNTLQRSTEAAKASWGGLGGIFTMVGGYLGFQQANKSLIGFNSNLEQSKIQIAGLMAQAGRGEYASNIVQANTLVRQMQLDARASVGTTQDFVQMASMLIQPLTMAGASMENLRDMTKQTVVASRAMGIDAAVAARDVDQAVRGVYHSVDQFSGKILTPLGYGGEEGRKKFNQLSMQQRLAELQRGLGTKAIADMASAQETSFAGVTSTLVDNIQMTLGKVGMPLFKAITAEVQRWNEWLDRNQSLVAKLADEYGNKILTAAKALADATKFMVDHWRQLLGLWAGSKMLGVLTSGGMTNALTAAGNAAGAGTFGAASTALAGKAAAITLVASAVYIGATALVDWVEQRQSNSLDMASRYGVGVKGGTIDALISSVERYRSSQTDAERKSNAQVMMALAKNQGITNAQTMEEAAGFWSSDQRLAMARALGQKGGWDSNRGIRQEFGFVSAEDVARAFDETRMSNVIQEWLPDRSGLNTGSGLGWMEKYNSKAPKVEKPKVNVTIHKIEVASDDPDRFAFSFVDALRDVARNPSGVSRSVRVLRES